MNQQKKPLLLIVAQSARMLSQMAIANGYSVIAIDCYGDCDTRNLALELRQVDSLAQEDLQPVVSNLLERHSEFAVLYGSGFELYPESLRMLANYGCILGNPAELVSSLLDKAQFFQFLDDLDIVFPETRFARPDNPEGWLFKPLAGCGGLGIRRADTMDNHLPNGYWQRCLVGENYSALFLATGGKGKILGWNRQWVAGNPDEPYQFAGVQNHVRLNCGLQRQIRTWLKRLSAGYSLCGLGSIDFMVTEDRCYLLEVNARIPASAQLYGNKLLSRHISAYRGEMSALRGLRSKPMGLQIVTAKQQTIIPTAINWPTWTVDLPSPGLIIERGQPICSIIAGGKNPAQVLARLQRRIQIIESLLNLQTF